MLDAKKTEWNFQEILGFQFPALLWFVEGLIAGGLTLFWGPPKLGKSWLALQFLFCISQGKLFLGKLKTRVSKVVFISLEDSPRRIQSRLKKIGLEINENAQALTEIKGDPLGNLENFLRRNPEVKVVVIDTLQRFLEIGDLNDYSKTSHAMAKLKKITDDFGIAVIAIHHSRKSGAEFSHFTDSALGSQGLTGAADHLLVLQRDRKDSKRASLNLISKDSGEKTFFLRFSDKGEGWELAPRPSEAKTPEQLQVLDSLQKVGEGSITTGELAKVLGKTASSLSRLLKKLEEIGEVQRIKSGEWSPVKEKDVS